MSFSLWSDIQSECPNHEKGKLVEKNAGIVRNEIHYADSNSNYSQVIYFLKTNLH